jgi:glycerol-1-phosphate dehydrogenase [NAD(P)+]
VVAIGGGRCLDVAKLIAAGAGKPFVAVPTQLSHDGVCSPVSVLPRVAGGLAESLEAVAPHLAFFSRPTLIRSPIDSLRAGIGDLISNPFALRDWKLAAEAGLETINRPAWRLSAESFGLIEGLLDEPFGAHLVDPWLIGVLAHALATSGLAMTTAGTSRPASGAEHKISHAIDELFGVRAHHGAQVAFGSVVSAFLHGLDVDALRRCLENVGLPHHPHQLGLSHDDMVNVLLRAPATRPGRFTILEQAALQGPEAAAVVRAVWLDY